jgi:ketosteroid isomerase-like protein
MSDIETIKRFADLIETKDLNGLQAMLADDFTAKGPKMELNKQQIVGYLKILFTAFPDISFGLTEFEEKDDLIYCASHEKGTHNVS